MIDEEIETVRCIVGISRPVPTFIWRLNNQTLSSLEGSSSSEGTKSILEQSYSRSSSGSKLECVVRHPGYPEGERAVGVLLDVLCR